MSSIPIVGGRLGLRHWLALVATAVGLALVAVALMAQVGAPQAPRPAGRVDAPLSSKATGEQNASGTTATAAQPPRGSSPAPLPASTPVRLRIPAIGVESPMIRLGLARDGTLAVPQPGPDLNKAAWFQNSPTPGQPGPSIVEGHVLTKEGPSVFYELGKIRPGNRIFVTRADGVEAVFTVNAVRDYPKTKFPTNVVYGAKNLGVPQLRIITCSRFDPAIGHYTGNQVVFAQLTSTR